MMIRKPQVRRGATIVETAAVLSIALLFLFGIVEYARYIFFLQVADNAVREAARYAAVHTGDGTATGNLNDMPTFETNPNYSYVYKAPNSSVRSVVNYQLGNLRNSIASYNVNVYNANPQTGLTLGGSWTDSPFAGGLVVELTGNYQFFLPNLLRLNGASLPVSIKAMTTSEAN